MTVTKPQQTPELRPHASHWGNFAARVDAGVIAEAVLNAADPDPSPLVHGVVEAQSSGVRVRRPAVRESWLRARTAADDGEVQGEFPHDSRPQLRGLDPFVEVSWDRALELVAGELKRVRAQHGNTSIFGGSYGWSSAGRFHHARTQLRRFLGSTGGFVDQVGNYSYGAAAAILPHVLGSPDFASGRTTSWDVIEEHTELWLLFGGLPLKNTQCESGGITRHTARGWLQRIADGGTKIVSISPLRDDTPSFARPEWVAPRPGTDTALMLGLAHTLLAEGLHDERFLARYCVGWQQLRAYLLGEEDGAAKTAEWAGRITDVAPQTIRGLARRMARSRTMISVSWSLQRADHGEQPYWMAIALAAMLGQIGLPGGGFGFAYGSGGTNGQVRYPFPAPALRLGLNPESESNIPVARVTDMLLNPGGTYEFDGATKTYPDIRMIYWAGGNPFHHQQDLHRLLEAWRRPETIVVHEPWWTPAARHADIVLPASVTLERNDIGAASHDPAIVAMHQAVAPLGEARSDFEIFCGLADRLGALEAFAEGRDEKGWITHIYGATREIAERYGYQLPPFDEFWAAGGVEVPATSADPATSHVLLESFRQDPEAHPLPTPSGRIELYSETIAGFGYDDCPPHPAWLEPAEWLGGADAIEGHLHLLTNQPAHRLHSQLDMAKASRDAKVAGREPCRLSVSDAAARGITTGDVVRLFNARGSCLAGAVVSEEVRPGVVQLSTGAWFELDRAGASEAGTRPLEIHGNPNVLTRDHGTSRLAQGCAAQTALVEIERYEGLAPPVTVTSQLPAGVSG